MNLTFGHRSLTLFGSSTGQPTQSRSLSRPTVSASVTGCLSRIGITVPVLKVTVAPQRTTSPQKLDAENQGTWTIWAPAARASGPPHNAYAAWYVGRT